MNTLKDVLPSFDSNPPSPRSDGEFPICEDGTVAQEIPSFEFSERLSPEERDVTQEINAKALMVCYISVKRLIYISDNKITETLSPTMCITGSQVAGDTCTSSYKPRKCRRGKPPPFIK